MSIKSKIKLYSEANHPNTCLTSDILHPNRPIVSKGDYSIGLMLLEPGKSGVLVTDEKGNASCYYVPDGDEGRNKILATDASGNLVWIDKTRGGTQ